MYSRYGFLATILSLFIASNRAAADAPALRKEADRAMRRACAFYGKQVSTEGGYLWRYSADLKKREGEGKAGERTVWIQPPGTPTVGLGLLEAYRVSGHPLLLEMARRAGICLVRGQLESGGWDYRIEFDPARRKLYRYRVEKNGDARRNVTTLDDNNTQSALRFLMRLDKTLGFKDRQIHEAVQFALDALLKAQYPIGAWPQRYDEFPDPAKYPVKKANYPESWSRTWPKKNYKGYYTFNDNAIADVIDVMFEAERTYGDKKYRAAAERAGDFILAAQMPEPQPAWAQQYNLDMQPAWARKFEPPGVTGGESQGVMLTLLRLYRETGKKKYMEPIPRAVRYLRTSQLPDGRLARFYELKTNRPLYFTRKYQLTYDDGDLPTHYGFKVGHKLDRIEQQFKQLAKLSPQQLADLNKPRKRGKPKWSTGLENQTRAVIDALDERGAWVEEGALKYQADGDDTRRIIQTRTFVSNIAVLARYLAATQSSSNMK